VIVTDAHRDELSPSYSWYIRDWRASHRVREMSWKERGFYRECLDWAWDLNGLPDDLGAIRARLRASVNDFRKLWPVIEAFFPVDTDGRRRNPRQECERAKQNTNRKRASDGGNAKGNAKVAAQQAPASSTPPSPTPSTASHGAPPLPLPSPLPVPRPVPLQPDARSGRPMFDGQRLTVFEWQLTELMKLLGPHTDAFDLHAWFFTADGKAMASGVVKKPRDWWPWLFEETVAEAIRRGLPMAGVTNLQADADAVLAEVRRQNKAAGR
jgi:uncharacterized protein YdaU (DUF1376 family)